MTNNIDTKPEILDHIQTVDMQRRTGNFNNMLPVVDVDIPASVVLPCPMAKNHLSQAKACKGCAHFKGVVQTAYNDKIDLQWDYKFAISCAYPLDRKCSTVCFSGNEV